MGLVRHDRFPWVAAANPDDIIPENLVSRA